MPCYQLHRSQKRVQCDRFASLQRVSRPMQGNFRGRRHCCSAYYTGPDRGDATEWTKPGFRQGTQAFHVVHVPDRGARRQRGRYSAGRGTHKGSRGQGETCHKVRNMNIHMVYGHTVKIVYTMHEDLYCIV